MNMLRRITVAALLCCICFVCAGCKKSGDAIYKVDGETLTSKEVTAYGIVFAWDHGLQSGEDLDAIYEDGKTYETYYKEELQKDIVDSLILYTKAQSDKFELDKDQKKQMKKDVDSIVKECGERWLEEKGVKRTDIEYVCKLRNVSSAFVEQEMNKGNEDESDKDDNRYIQIYQVQFMTVEMKDNGMISTSKDGMVNKLSGNEIQNVKSEAEDFARRAKEEDSITISRKEYKAYMSQTENYYKYSDLEPGFQRAVDGMKKGDISDVVEFQYGYCVFKLLDGDAKDFSNSLSSYEESEQQKTFKENWMKELRRELTINEDLTENTEYWKNVKLADFMRK